MSDSRPNVPVSTPAQRDVRVPLTVLIPLVSLFASAESTAHPSLYHQIELDLRDPATVRLYLTIHTPELPSSLAAGVDPVAGDPAWLRSRSDEELKMLIREGEMLIREIFSFGLTSGVSDNVMTPMPLPLGFETPAKIRDPAHDNGLPEGCLLATAEFANPGAPREFFVDYAGRGDKRLMLLVARPAAFPEVKDLVPGESVRVPLPERPPGRRWTSWGRITVGLFLGSALVTFAGCVMRRGKVGGED